MIDDLRHVSPTPQSGCRRTALSDSGGTRSSTRTQLYGGRKKCVRRKRLELRRLKSLEQIKSAVARGDDCKSIAGEVRCFKKRRRANRKVDTNQSDKEEEECSNKRAVGFSVSLSEDDAVFVGTSSFVDEENNAKQNVRSSWSHGLISVIGRRREMEDAVAVELRFLTVGSKEYDFFGVYDGHGGSLVAHACRDRFHRLLVEIVEERGHDEIDWNKVMLESFEKIDEEVNKKGAAVATMGSTAVVAMVGEEELVVANCGDSRAVVSRGGVAMPLSSDHKPDRPDELERIELSGGKVINWNGQRILGVLATSRSIGDRYLKPYVISDPEVIVSKRTRKDEFLILASDGLWDVVPNDVACHVVRRCLDGQIKRAPEDVINGKRFSAEGEVSEKGNRAAEAAAVLAELAIARGSKDNISVIVVELRGCCNSGGVGCCSSKSQMRQHCHIYEAK